jgi:teichuronic acid exporter
VTDINRTLRRSVLINVVGRYSNIVIQLIVTAILARSLNPQDFGVMAVVSVLAVFLAFVSEMGLGPAIIQFNDLKAGQLAGLFWTTIVVGSVTGLALSLSGPLIAKFYAREIYVQIAHGIGLNVALSCWAIVPLALLRRNQRFQTIAGIEIASAALSGVCAVYWAMQGGGVEALVVKSSGNALFMFAICMICARPPLRSPSIRGMKHVFSYSSYQFMFNLVNYFTRNLDKLLIGKFMGATQLGIYDMSYRLMLMPISNLTHVVTPAIQPVYSEHGNRPDVIFASYQKLLRVLLVGGGFVGLVCIVCSSEIIELTYGPKWKSAIPIFSILSLSIALQVVLSSTGSVFQALGKTNLLFKSGVLSTITTVIAITIGVYVGDLELLSWLLIGSFFINGMQAFYILAHGGFNRSIADLFRPAHGILTGIVMLSVVALAGRHQIDAMHGSLLIRAATKGLVVSVLYLGVVCCTGDAKFILRALAIRKLAPQL